MRREYPLNRLLEENAWFFSAFAVFLVLGAILLGNTGAGDTIFFFSERRSLWGDLFFLYFTKMGEGLVFVLGLVILLFIRFRHAFVLPFLGLSVSLASFLFKEVFQHDRPFLYLRKIGAFEQINTVEGVVLNGGNNSFPSGHTMAAFALYAFLAFCLPRKKGVGLALFATAFLVGISRVYLVQHFFKDVYLGAILGLLIAMIWYVVQYRLPEKAWMDKKLSLP